MSGPMSISTSESIKSEERDLMFLPPFARADVHASQPQKGKGIDGEAEVPRNRTFIATTPQQKAGREYAYRSIVAWPSCQAIRDTPPSFGDHQRYLGGWTIRPVFS